MKNRKLTDEIKVDEIGGHKQSKITSNSVIAYNEPKALNGLDLVYWDYIKGLLPEDSNMEYLGELVSLPNVDVSDDGKVAKQGDQFWIVEDGEWIEFSNSKVISENTSQILISGDGTESDKLKANLSQSILDDINKGITAYDEKIVSAAFTGNTNKTLTLTKQNGTTVKASFLDNNDPQVPDDVINSLEFNINNDGKLTAITSEGAIIDTNLDGRYSLLNHKHSAADITSGTLSDSRLSSNIARIGDLVDTTYTAGTGLDLSGTQFSIDTPTMTKINHGETAYDWGDFRDFGLGAAGSPTPGTRDTVTRFIKFTNNGEFDAPFDYGAGININYSKDRSVTLYLPIQSLVNSKPPTLRIDTSPTSSYIAEFATREWVTSSFQAGDLDISTSGSEVIFKQGGVEVGRIDLNEVINFDKYALKTDLNEYISKDPISESDFDDAWKSSHYFFSNSASNAPSGDFFVGLTVSDIAQVGIRYSGKNNQELWLRTTNVSNTNTDDWVRFVDTNMLSSELNSYVKTSLTITAGTGLSGGGNLSSSRTISLANATTSTIGGVKRGTLAQLTAGTDTEYRAFRPKDLSQLILDGVYIKNEEFVTFTEGDARGRLDPKTTWIFIRRRSYDPGADTSVLLPLLSTVANGKRIVISANGDLQRGVKIYGDSSSSEIYYISRNRATFTFFVANKTDNVWMEYQVHG